MSLKPKHKDVLQKPNWSRCHVIHRHRFQQDFETSGTFIQILRHTKHDEQRAMVRASPSIRTRTDDFEKPLHRTKANASGLGKAIINRRAKEAHIPKESQLVGRRP
jgi:hypothetical protein